MEVEDIQSHEFDDEELQKKRSQFIVRRKINDF
jgi:hypothetical protein